MHRGTLLVSASSVVFALSGPASAQVTQRVSIAPGGTNPNLTSYYAAVSADGRYVAFESDATNLVPNDTNHAKDVFVRDRLLGTNERVTVSSSGAQANASGGILSRAYHTITPDGRFVSFCSDAPNLAPNDTAGNRDVFLRDRQLGTTELVSVSLTGTQGNGDSITSSISADGRFVAFNSLASNLVPGDTNGKEDIFVRDRLSGTTERVSVSSGAAQGNSNSEYPTISADGRYVAFMSFATNLVQNDTNSTFDIFVHDRQTGFTSRVSTNANGIQGNDASTWAMISGNGRYVAIYSYASNLVPNDLNGAPDAFVKDLATGAIERVSVSNGGFEANAGILDGPTISADGRFVEFSSDSTNLVEDTNDATDVFVHDRRNHTTERVSVSSQGFEGNSESSNGSISTSGRYVVFASFANTFALEDTSPWGDIYFHDLVGGTAITSLCFPGLGPTVPCPCGNPPSGPGRGCDNSAATGGAVLSADGGAFLSSDTLVFHATGERGRAVSTLTQYRAVGPTGMTFGQGVHCAGGSSRLMYMKYADGGNVSMPDYLAGDQQVSARSVSVADPILPGESRYYVVDYRDPIVLGGCAARNTVNSTQVAQITWAP